MQRVHLCASGLMVAGVALFTAVSLNAQELGSISFPTSGAPAAQPKFI